MYNNLDIYLLAYQEKLHEVERLNQRHLRSWESRPHRQKRRFDLRRLLFFL